MTTHKRNPSRQTFWEFHVTLFTRYTLGETRVKELTNQPDDSEAAVGCVKAAGMTVLGREGTGKYIFC